MRGRVLGYRSSHVLAKPHNTERNSIRRGRSVDNIRKNRDFVYQSGQETDKWNEEIKQIFNYLKLLENSMARCRKPLQCNALCTDSFDISPLRGRICQATSNCGLLVG
jgi:hypothetical protein